MSSNYKGNKLFFAKTNLSKLVLGKESAFYLYNLDGMLEKIDFFQKCIGQSTKIHYAIKANSHPLILSTFAKKGLGADVVSKGEIEIALRAGFLAKNIIFSGVGKSKSEITFALEKQIAQINVESISELKRIAEISKKLKVKVPVAFRLNPNVNPETHPYITTGFRDNKFGIEAKKIPELIKILKENSDDLNFMGVTIHIGSQITEASSFRATIRKVVPLFKKFSECGFTVKTFDIGGGIGVDYENG